MRIIKRHRTKQGLVSLLLAALMGGVLIAGSGPQVKADTIGDTLDNSALTLGTMGSGSNAVNAVMRNNSPWSMYSIPGLSNNRFRSPSEGSFVKYGYNGWQAQGAGMPLSADISNPSGSESGSSLVSKNTTAWRNGTTASPVAITFKTKGDGKHGQPYFSLNYVDKDNLVDFGVSDQAATISQAWAGQATNQLTSDQQSQIYNPTGVSSKMTSSNGQINGTPVLASNSSFDNGYLQATGNVPISAAVASSKDLVDATMAGDWAVMVRVQVAKGIDAKALAASVDWDKSYYYLTVDSVPLLGTKVTNINFPLQFDHHVYLDPNNSQQFFLKVKGIPFWFRQLATQEPFLGTWKDGYAQLQLQNGNADYMDYLNNRQIAKDSNGVMQATTLDNLGPAGSTSWPTPLGSKSTVLDDSKLIKKTNGNIQPDFTTQISPANVLNVGNPLWSVYDLYPLTSGKSTILESGQLGQMVAMINNAGSNAVSSRPYGGNALYAALLSTISSYFTNSPFTGSAHINFSFDMSKYEAGTTKDQKSLTDGRLFAAPNANGTFNTGDGTAASNAIRITMYDSSDLVDPYNITKGVARNQDDSNGANAMQKTLHIVQSNQNGQSTESGMTPADYAVIRNDKLDDGTTYPTYTNFTSWTGAIVPYDREHWTDDNKNPINASFTDTLHSQGKFGTDLKSRTSTPDPANDGVLVNDGSPFKIDQTARFTSDYIEKYQPVFDKTDKTKLTTAGVITPQRYANVYSLYNYDSQGVGTLPADGKPVPVYTTTGTGGNNLSVKAGKALMTSPPIATNVAQGATQLTASLDNGKWHYTGTMDSGGTTLQLADATIGLSQPLNPQLTLNGQSPYLVDDTELKGSGLTRELGTWRDPLAISTSDSLKASLSTEEPASGSTPGITQQQDANWANITDVDTQAHAMSFNVANGNPFANPNDATRVTHPNGSLSAQFAYQMPTKDSPQSRVYYGEIELQRTATVGLAQGYKLDPNADYNKAKANYYIFRNQDTPDVDWYTVKKYFDTTNQPTTHYVTADDKSNQNAIPVKSEVTQTDQGKQNKSQDLDIWIPKVTGTSLQNANTTPITVTDNTGGSGTTIASANIKDISAQQPSWVSAGYYTYSIHFPEVPTKFTYSYAYVISSGGVDASEYKMPLYDVVRNSTQMLGLSNPIYFDTMHAVNLLHAPSFDFGKNNVPTAAANYKLTDDSKANAYFEAQENDGDNQHNTYTWMLSATMTPFKSSMTDAGYSDFNILLDKPYLDAAGTQVDSKENHQPDPSGLISDGYSAPQLYYVDPLTDPDTPSYDANSIKRYYPNASLTVPAETITPGKYQSTMTYTVSDNGSI